MCCIRAELIIIIIVSASHIARYKVAQLFAPRKPMFEVELSGMFKYQ